MKIPPETPFVALIGAIGYTFIDPDARNRYGVLPTVIGAFVLNCVGFLVFYAATYRRGPTRG